MPWWVYLLIALVGLAFAALTRRGIARRTGGQTPEREGPGSLLYYLFVDWWIGWF
jgi:hypothetical protein